MVESLRKNERIQLNIESTIADGLAVNMVGVNTFHNIKGLIDKMVSIDLYVAVVSIDLHVAMGEFEMFR